MTYVAQNWISEYISGANVSFLSCHYLHFSLPQFNANSLHIACSPNGKFLTITKLVNLSALFQGKRIVTFSNVLVISLGGIIMPNK